MARAARRLLWALLLVCLLGVSAEAREKRFGYCQLQLTGSRVTNCTVTVYLNGTLTLATLYQDNIGTPQGNPFTADPNSGIWSFYSDNGRYDVQFSGGTPTISPAYTVADYLFLDLGTQGQSVTFGGDILPAFTNQGNVGNVSFVWGGGDFNNLVVTGTFISNSLFLYSGTSFLAEIFHNNTAARNYQLPDASGTLPLLSSAQTWTGNNNFSVQQNFSAISSLNGLTASGGFINMANTDSIQAWSGTANVPLLSMTGATPIVAGVLFENISGGILLQPTSIAFTSQSITIVATTASGSNGAAATLSGSNAIAIGGASRSGGIATVSGGNGSGPLGIGANVVLAPGTGNGGNGDLIIQQGLTDGSGFKHQNVSTGAVSPSSRSEVTLTWTTPFIDTNYDPICTVQDGTTIGTSQGLVLERTRQKTAALVTAVVFNPTGSSITGTLSCVAVHN